MKKLYICRGTGKEGKEGVTIAEVLLELETQRISACDLDDCATCNAEVGVVPKGYNGSEARIVCYDGWLAATGIKIAPGEVTAVEFKEVPA